jgi:nucleotide-binding universal stress UspA family protein
MISDRGFKNIRKILLPIDGSVTSMKAARYGISLATKFKSDLIGLTVIDLTSLPYGYVLIQAGTRSQEEEVLEEKRREAKKWLEEVERSMLDVLKETEDKKGKFRSEILEDPFSKVENAIIEYAENENVDLIVMGSRGRSRLRRALLGSVASALLLYARCPVLIVR